jgi:hypothetical protein
MGDSLSALNYMYKNFLLNHRTALLTLNHIPLLLVFYPKYSAKLKDSQSDSHLTPTSSIGAQVVGDKVQVPRLSFNLQFGFGCDLAIPG